MRSYERLIPTLLIGIVTSITLFSCGKNTTPDPVPGTDTILSEQKLTGKWEISAIRYLTFHNDSIVHRLEFLKDVGGVEDNIQMGSEPWIPDLHVTYLTFKPDHTFSHTDINGVPNGYMLFDMLGYENTAWTLKSPKTLELTTTSQGGVVGQEDWNVFYNTDIILLWNIDTLNNSNNLLVEEVRYIEATRK